MNKKSIILVGIVFAIIIIALTVYLVLTLTTDLFKPTSEIFQRYLKEGIANIEQIADFSKEKEYINTLTQSNYKENTKLELNYKNSQEKVENFSLSSEGITNNSENNSYRKINLMYGEDYNVMNVEYLQENQTYGLLFSNVVKQFISADIDSLEKLKSLIGIDVEKIGKTDMIKSVSLIEKEKDNLKNVFLNYISKLSNSKFSKLKDSQITLNNGDNQIASEYLINLNEEETKTLYIELLNALDKKSDINSINTNKVQFSKTSIALYVKDNKIIRAVVDTDNKQIKIDLYENQLNIKFNNITGEEIKTVSFDLKREEKLTTIEYTDSFNNKNNIKYEILEDGNNKNSKIQLAYQNDYIKDISLTINQNIEMANSVIEGIEKKFSEQPNINISGLNEAERSSSINGLLRRIDTLLTNENNQVNSELLNIWIQFNKKMESEYQGIKEKLKNEFNNKFLAYRGQNLEKEIILNLLDLSGLNMERYEEIGEESFKIYLSQGTNNVDLANEIKNKLEKTSKIFSVNFGFDSEGKANILEIRGYEKQQ